MIAWWTAGWLDPRCFKRFVAVALHPTEEAHSQYKQGDRGAAEPHQQPSRLLIVERRQVDDTRRGGIKTVQYEIGEGDEGTQDRRNKRLRKEIQHLSRLA